MAEDAPLIIEVALNGGTPKSRNANVPRSPAEIAADAIRCIDGGAAIVHNHNDEPVLGGPDGVHNAAPYIEAWTEIIAARPGAILYPTMASGGPHTTIEERYGHLPKLADAGVLGQGLVDPGSVNLGPLDSEGLPVQAEIPYINTLRDARHMFSFCRERGIGPSISIFEPGFLRVALAYHRAGWVPPGAMVKLYFGGDALPFGLPPTEASLDAYLAMMRDSGLHWSVATLGGDVVANGLALLALERGGHVRVGLEDYAGPRTPTNLELVEELVGVAARAGRRIAEPAEARAVLGLGR